MVATIAAAVAVRSAGAPVGAAILIGVSALYLMHDMPTAPFAMLCLLVGVTWVEVSRRSQKSPQEG